MKNLVIVESPAKAKTITKYLNSNPNLKSYGVFVVASSMGHVRDLKKKELGIDITNNFTPTYQITDDKAKVVAELKKKAADADVVWLASDYDREGEGIAMHLKDVLKLKKYHRITFTEITPRALETAIRSPRLIDTNLVHSQETRRILDRLVGFKISPLLWKRFNTSGGMGLSAGRVQSAVMNIILQREKDIRGFQSIAYWYFLGHFMLRLGKTEQVELEDIKLYKDNHVYKEANEKQVTTFYKNIKNVFTVEDVKSKQSKRNPEMPFITSSLQQEAYNKFGFPINRTMKLAQELYEHGHITYMRTDSYNISEEFRVAAANYIIQEYGANYYGGGVSRRKSQKNAQEAHEAIRPSNITVLSSDLDMSGDHKKLYDMIWKRTVAFFMTACVYDELEIKIVDESFKSSKAAEGDMYFSATFTKVKFNGYLKVYGVESETYDFSGYVKGLSNPKTYALKCVDIVAKNTWQSPPQRYTESSIVKVLESEGIGRPSTYAGILSKLFDKRYIIKSDINGVKKKTKNYVYKGGRVTEDKGEVTVGEERTRIVPTEIGETIDRFLQEHFSYIVDKKFTANMEADLDKIAEGDKQKLEVLSMFWEVFGKDVAKLESIKEKKTTLKLESNSLDVDGVKYIIRFAKYGPVIEYESGGQKKYIGLKSYMKQFRKELNSVDADDVRLLTSLPRTVGVIDGSPFNFVYGPYGFYGKYKERNIKLPFKVVKNILGGMVVEDDLRKCIDYVPKPRK